MALTHRLELRQSQSLVMTPQLQQAIKLLQLSNMELNEFVEGELERNPLLETPAVESEAITQAGLEPNVPLADIEPQKRAEADDWISSSGENNKEDPSANLDTRVEDVYPDLSGSDKVGLNDQGWTQQRSSTRNDTGSSGSDYNLENFVQEEITLHDHLADQLSLSKLNDVQRLIGAHLIDMVDEQGYLRGSVESVAIMLGTEIEAIEDVLEQMQRFEPTGVFAQNLADCMRLQLIEQNRYDPAMQALLENIHLLAAHNFSGLKKACQVSDEDLSDMIAEIKHLNPKPGLQFGSVTVQPVVPDVFVRQNNDGSWLVELNTETLPRVLVNQSYYTVVAGAARDAREKSYIQDCLQTANWLVKSLDQRARTILKVAEEIVRQQDGFFSYGVEHLRPLNLRAVADAIDMHESTVSRVTSNKYIGTSRGVFELKYFFTSAISSSCSEDMVSSEAVRHHIRQLIDAEQADAILSDDKIVSSLRDKGIDIARRTVAKYREAMGIPSSVQRRRKKRMAQQMAI
ncbi:MAG: RNA polymerase sigma-54 factor 2 [Rhodomicrobium sp.]|nr:MAG: RNA polymerase sigma-54 factor 2 [Rhodomicrobium sp.]